MPGVTGKIFKVIPTAVFMIFTISLIEALFILPAHLSRKSKGEDSGLIHWANKRREWFGDMIRWLQNKPFKRFLNIVLKHRYITLAIAISLLMMSIGVVASGRIDFSFMSSYSMSETVKMEKGLLVQMYIQNQLQLLLI